MGKVLSVEEQTPRRRRFGCGSMILFALLLLVAAGGIAAWMAFSEPAGWKEVTRLVDAVPQAERAELSESLQKRFFNALQGIDSSKGIDPANPDVDGVRIVKLSIPVRDANLWLMTQMPELLKNQNKALPNGISDPRIWIDKEELVLSCRLSLSGYSGIASFGIKAELHTDGLMHMRITGVKTGKLPVPTGAVAAAVKEELKKAKDEVVRHIGEAFDGTSFDPVFNDPGDPERQTRLIGLQILPDRVDLTLRNAPRQAE